MRKRRGAAALLMLLALLGAVPMALSLMGNPLSGWSDLRAGDLSATVVVDLLLAVSWLAWAQFAVSTVLELLGRLSRIEVPELPGPLGAQQHLARGLVAGVLLLAPAAGALPPTAFTVPSAQPVASATYGVSTATAARPAPRAQSAPPLTSAVNEPSAVGAHGVEAQDGSTWTYTVPASGGLRTYWALAEAHLGDGDRWPRIWALNEGRVQADGAVLSSAGLLRAGWTVLMPGVAPAPSHPLPRAQAGGDVVTVRAGDTLSQLVEDHGERDWHRAWQANAGRAEPGGRHYTDPDLILPGWTLDLPAAAGAVQVPPPAPDPGAASSASSNKGAPSPRPGGVLPYAAPQAAATAAPGARARETGEHPAAELPSARSTAAAAGTAHSTEAAAARRAGSVATDNPRRAAPVSTAGPPASSTSAASRSAHSAATARPGAARPGAPTSRARPADAAPARATSARDASARSASSSARWPWLAGGGGVLAVGLLALLDRARRCQRRASGRASRHSAPELTEIEVGLRVLAEPESAQFLDAALRSLPMLLRDVAGDGTTDAPGNALPALLAARLSSAALELYLAEPATAPAPFTAEADGRIWRVSARAALPFRSADAGTVLEPYPALLPIGRDEVGLVLVDLEGIGCLALDGAAQDTAAVLRRLAAELAVADWAGLAHATLVGFGAELARLDPERLTFANRLDEELLASLEATAREVGRAQHAEHGDDIDVVLAARHRAAPIAYYPQIVLLAGPPTGDGGERLAALLEKGEGSRRSSLAVVVAGAWPGAHWSASLSPAGLLALDPVGLLVQANGLDTRTETALAALVDDAREPSEPPPDAEHEGGAEGTEDVGDDVAAAAGTAADGPAAQPDPPPVRRGVQAAARPRPRPVDDLDEAVELWFGDEPAVRVAVLGEVSATGPGPLPANRRGIVVPLVVYLITHRGGVPVTDLDLALWPECGVQRRTRTQAVARARAALGFTADGSPRLSLGTSGLLTLSTDALLDWELFARLAARADTSQRRGDQSAAAGDRAIALRLVRGVPFKATTERRYSWLPETHLEHDIPSAVVSVAHRLAGYRLEIGDPAGARDAARTGQLVDRYATPLWHDLMRAAHALGQPEKVATLLADQRKALDADDDDELDPETLELAGQLLPRLRRPRTLNLVRDVDQQRPPPSSPSARSRPAGPVPTARR